MKMPAIYCEFLICLSTLYEVGHDSKMPRADSGSLVPGTQDGCTSALPSRRWRKTQGTAHSMQWSLKEASNRFFIFAQRFFFSV